MKFKREEHEGVVLLQLYGDLGKPEAEQLRKLILELMNEGKYRFVLDLEEIRYVDSFAIMILLRLNRESMGGGGEIKLLRPRNVVKRFMDIGKVLELFERYETKIEAIRSFKKDSLNHRVAPVNHLHRASQRQRQVIMRLVEILVKKGAIDPSEFHYEINRSAHLVLQIFRKEFGA